MVKFGKEKAWELENMLKLVLEGIYDDDIFCSSFGEYMCKVGNKLRYYGEASRKGELEVTL